MKITKSLSFALSALFALSLGATACGNKDVPLQSAASVPAAKGNVDSEVTSDGNTKIAVEVEHLAPPEKVASGATVYVVWAKPQTGENAQNLGAMKVDDDRKGKLETMTPLKSFQVMVTPEASASVLHPSNDPVMTATVSH